VSTDHIIDAAKFEKVPIWCLGPFARRVSFVSQQRRALNLVGALKRSDLIKPEDRIAIVGGGLAGLVAAAALVGQKCQVEIYEAQAELFQYQKKATHRFIHPSISRWPDIEMPLHDTTNFPFFDWYAAPCSEVVVQFEREWNAIVAFEKKERKALGLSSRITLHLSRRVAKLIWDKDYPAFGVSLETEPRMPVAPFKGVIVTTGFGPERKIEGIDWVSYWDSENDKLDGVGEGFKWVVSGCGDGGLIDTLRLLYGGFAGGKLAIDIAKMIVKENVDLSEVIRLEKDLRFSDEDTTATDLKEMYVDVALDLPASIKSALNAALGTTLPLRVQLYSQTLTGFSSNAAPIHKIMLAHALSKFVVTHTKATLKVDSDNKPVVLIGTTEQPLAPHEGITVRHGPEATLGGLLAEYIDKLKATQSHRSDYIDEEPPSEIFPPAGYPPSRNGQSPEFIGLRRSLAEGYLKSINPGAVVDATATGLAYRVPPGENVEVPGRLFGITLMKAEEPEPADLLIAAS
jgi:hypothetical protein